MGWWKEPSRIWAVRRGEKYSSMGEYWVFQSNQVWIKAFQGPRHIKASHHGSTPTQWPWLHPCLEWQWQRRPPSFSETETLLPPSGSCNRAAGVAAEGCTYPSSLVYSTDTAGWVCQQWGLTWDLWILMQEPLWPELKASPLLANAVSASSIARWPSHNLMGT